MKTAKKTILFVEDNPLVLSIYRSWLQRDGFQVESAEDGLAALEKLPQVKPDVVVLDLMLPRMNGLEVLKFIREHADLKTIPVLILSNAYMDEPASHVMTAGANKRMLKTQCTPKKLIEAVRELLDITPVSHRRSQNDSALAEANEALLKEARNNLLEDAPKEIARIRERCLAFVKTAGSPVNAEHLNDLYQQVRFLCTRVGLGDCPKVAHLVSALEAMLFEIISRKSMPSPSVLQTIAQAVDCLGRLFQNGDIHSADGFLKAKVLIVDDDPVCNFATVAAMKRAKLEAISTEQPTVALELAQTELYSIVLLDINMPGLSGFELCEKIRLLPQYKRIPVVFVTSYSEFQNRAQAVLSGGNDLIAKPISPLELVLKTIMLLVGSSEEYAVKSPARVKTRSAIEPAVSSAAEQVELHAERILTPGENGNAIPPIAAPASDKPNAAPKDGKSVAPAGEDELNRAASPCPLPEVAFPAPLRFAPEHLPVNRINQPRNDTNHEMLMKDQNENQPFEMITREVTRIIFGDGNLSEMPLRLTRIALERYNVPEIIRRSPGSGARGNGSLPDSVKGDPFHQVTREVARIIFGDESISEMHLRLTSIALERYHVPEMIHRLPETNTQNGSPVEHAHSGRL